MCCFRLYFCDINVLFFQKNKKLAAVDCCSKKSEKITYRMEK